MDFGGMSPTQSPSRLVAVWLGRVARSLACCGSGNGLFGSFQPAGPVLLPRRLSMPLRKTLCIFLAGGHRRTSALQLVSGRFGHRCRCDQRRPEQGGDGDDCEAMSAIHMCLCCHIDM